MKRILIVIFLYKYLNYYLKNLLYLWNHSKDLVTISVIALPNKDMNNIIVRISLLGDKFLLKIHLKQSGLKC